MPVWHLTVELSQFWNNDEIGFEEKRDGIVAALRQSKWRDITPYPDHFTEFVDELEETEDISQFDGVFAELYDLADSDRVWIETHGKVVKIS